jgi:thioredoxin 1
MTPVQATPETFDDLTQGRVLVKFTAPWCAPCKALDPVLASVAADGSLSLVHVNVDAYPDLAKRYRVQNLPTVLGFRDGDVQATLTGLHTRAHYDALAGKL